MLHAYLHPNANWYVPVFDARRRSVFYLTSRQLLAVDEPSTKIGSALERVLQRWERRDPTLRALRQMPDEDRVRLVLQFVAARPELELRDRLLQRLAERTFIVFGWRPGAIFDLVEWDDEPLATEYRTFIEHACRSHVALELSRLGEGQVFAADFSA